MSMTSVESKVAALAIVIIALFLSLTLVLASINHDNDNDLRRAKVEACSSVEDASARSACIQAVE